MALRPMPSKFAYWCRVRIIHMVGHFGQTWTILDQHLACRHARGECFAPIPALQGCHRYIYIYIYLHTHTFLHVNAHTHTYMVRSTLLWLQRLRFGAKHSPLASASSRPFGGNRGVTVMWCEALSSCICLLPPLRGKSGGSPGCGPKWRLFGFLDIKKSSNQKSQRGSLYFRVRRFRICNRFFAMSSLSRHRVSKMLRWTRTSNWIGNNDQIQFSECP